MNQPSARVVELARLAAMRSPCAKSKRGAIVVLDHGTTFSLLGSGHNGPPGDIGCDGTDNCWRDCGRICVHAEQRAIVATLAGASSYKPVDLSGLELLHLKVVDGVAVPGGPPSCWQCSKLILDVGVDSVWLYEDIGAGVGRWQRYTAKDFHLATLHNCKGGPLHGARL